MSCTPSDIAERRHDEHIVHKPSREVRSHRWPSAFDNFLPEHLERLLRVASVVPALNQIELHPFFQQRALQHMHREHGIATQAWSPTGGSRHIAGWRSAASTIRRCSGSGARTASPPPR